MPYTYKKKPFYVDSTTVTLTTEFQVINFNIGAKVIIVQNESETGVLYWSFDGEDVAGKITPGGGANLDNLEDIFESTTGVPNYPPFIYLKKGEDDAGTFNLSAW